VNIAKALIGSRRLPLRFTGVRPGEKLHEVMVSEEEVHHCVKRGDYYVIRPMLPELRGGKAREKNALTKEYSSGDNVMNLAATARLLKRTRLMVEQQELAPKKELLR
jgi:UDP-glucose 4-epimerase